MTNRLDSFETALLDELRRTVSQRGLDAPRRAVSRRALTVAISAGVAAIAAAIMTPLILATPAYAVSEDDADGTIHVRVNRLEDAGGLTEALAAHGVAADITYLGYEMTCAPGRFQEDVRSVPGSATAFTIGGGIEVTLDRRDISGDVVVVIAASHVRSDGVHGQVALARGAVAPCEPIALRPDELPHAE